MRLPILVVGAGPVGLAMAAELARHGAAVRLVDALDAPSTLSKAIALHARTLEAFADMGLVDAVLAAGQIITGVNLYGENHRLAHVELDPVDSPYPFVLNLAQDETERLLTAHAEALGVKVERGVKLEDLKDHGSRVSVTLRQADGTLEQAEAPWVVGCDGAHSAVRKALGLSFDGAPYLYDWVLGDVQLAGDLNRDEIHTFLHPEGLVACFPLGGQRVRLIADRPLQTGGSADGLEAHGKVKGDPTREELQAILDARGVPCAIGETHWLAAFRIHHRLAERHSLGRVFLAGDAAHIHSPAGGQGMNTGIQDAYNLGWKLAFAWRHAAETALLESYHAERHPVAKALLHDTDVMTRLVSLRGAAPRALRDRAIATLSQLGMVQQRMVNRLAEVEVHYPDSPLNVPQGWWARRAGGPQAGDRLPDLLLASPDGAKTRLHPLLHGTRHTLLCFVGTADAAHRAAYKLLAELLLERLGDGLAVLVIGQTAGREVYLDADGSAHARYGAQAGAVLLVRPDDYVAVRAATPEPGPFAAYLDRWLANPIYDPKAADGPATTSA